MSGTLTSDGWHRVAPGCPITADSHPADHTVEIRLGDRLGHDNAVTLVLSDPDTCDRLIKITTEARDTLIDLSVDDTTEPPTATAFPAPIALVRST